MNVLSAENLSFLKIQLRKFSCLVDQLKRSRKYQVWTICFFFDIEIKMLVDKEVSAYLHLAF